jgi:hypothetical protein
MQHKVDTMQDIDFILHQIIKEFIVNMHVKKIIVL